MGERMVGARGTRFFVDLRGAPDAPPLLYLHGGPGMSCHHFMSWQGDRLARDLHVVGLDQRGVLRSDPLGPGETFTEKTLVADCEGVRAALGIERWAVLGHSFGGRVALRYAVQHPDRVTAAVFECPGWDLAETERARLPAAAAVFEAVGDHESAARCRELAAASPSDLRESAEAVAGLVAHDRYDDLYIHQPGALSRWRDTEARPFPDELHARSGAHAEQAMAALHEPVLPLLRRLTTPATLIVGGHDLVCGPGQVAAFERLVPHGRVVRFPEAGHFAQLEEPETYAETVLAAVRDR